MHTRMDTFMFAYENMHYTDIKQNGGLEINRPLVVIICTTLARLAYAWLGRSDAARFVKILQFSV